MALTRAQTKKAALAKFKPAQLRHKTQGVKKPAKRSSKQPAKQLAKKQAKKLVKEPAKELANEPDPLPKPRGPKPKLPKWLLRMGAPLVAKEVVDPKIRAWYHSFDDFEEWIKNFSEFDFHEIAIRHALRLFQRQPQITGEQVTERVIQRIKSYKPYAHQADKKGHRIEEFEGEKKKKSTTRKTGANKTTPPRTSKDVSRQDEDPLSSRVMPLHVYEHERRFFSRLIEAMQIAAQNAIIQVENNDTAQMKTIAKKAVETLRLSRFEELIGGESQDTAEDSVSK